MLNFRTLLTSAGLCAVLAVAAHAQEPPAGQAQNTQTQVQSASAAASYETLIIKYVELNQAISSEERNWNETRAFMQREIEILKKEKALLTGQIEKMEQELAAEEEDRLGLLKKKEKNSAQLNNYKEILKQATDNLRIWQKLLPESISTAVCKPLFIRMGRIQKLSVPEQMELICGLYREIENIINSATLKREIIEDDKGQRQEYNVLYLGLAAAYAISDNGKRAALAFPSKEDKSKWLWSFDNSLSKDIRHAINLYKHETKADFIELPLQTMSPPEKLNKGADNE